MNPDTNQLEQLKAALNDVPADRREQLKNALGDVQLGIRTLLRPNGEPVPNHWSVFKEGENVVVKNYTFRVAYMNEGTLILEPVGPVPVGEGVPDKTL